MEGMDQLVVCMDRMVGPGLLQRRCSKRRAESDNVASGPPGGGNTVGRILNDPAGRRRHLQPPNGLLIRLRMRLGLRYITGRYHDTEVRRQIEPCKRALLIASGGRRHQGQRTALRRERLNNVEHTGHQRKIIDQRLIRCMFSSQDSGRRHVVCPLGQMRRDRFVGLPTEGVKDSVRHIDPVLRTGRTGGPLVQWLRVDDDTVKIKDYGVCGR